MTTTFGADVSHFQNINLSPLVAQGFDFFASKLTDGSTYVDPTYAGNLAEVKRVGGMFAAYHFMRSTSSAAAQADNIAKHIIDKSIPVMLDCEPSGSSKPTLALANDLRTELHARGIKASILYFPHFWWEAEGQPSLRGWAVWQAEYPSSKHQYASVLYSHDGNGGWAKEGGQVPVIWQFASTAKVDGYDGNLDVDAFDGTRDELSALGIFKDYSPHKSTKKPAPKPKPKPKPLTRIQKFHRTYASKGLVDLSLLDGAVKNGRVGTVKTVRDYIASQAHRVPKDSPLTHTFHSELDKDRVVDMNLLRTAISRGRVGTIHDVFHNIQAEVARLPEK